MRAHIYFTICSNVVPTQETRNLLREPGFDNWQWEDEEMLVLLQQMFLDLELLKKFDIEINILRNFLVRVYHHYNDVPFHNFRHCFCVTQMVCFLPIQTFSFLIHLFIIKCTHTRFLSTNQLCFPIFFAHNITKSLHVCVTAIRYSPNHEYLSLRICFHLELFLSRF